MLRVQLGEGDVLLIAMPVDEAEYIVDGSTRVECAECGRELWKAPDRPLIALHSDGIMRPAPLMPAATLIPMCPRCAEMHYVQRTGHSLRIR